MTPLHSFHNPLMGHHSNRKIELKKLKVEGMLGGGGWGVLLSALFCMWRNEGISGLQDYKLVSPLSIENVLKRKATTGSQNGPWDVYRGEAVLIWLNEVLCKEEMYSLLIDSGSYKTSRDRVY